MEEGKMRYGSISCSCGLEFYFESINETVECIKCGKVHTILNFPELEKEEEEIEVEPEDYIEEL